MSNDSGGNVSNMEQGNPQHDTTGRLADVFTATTMLGASIIDFRWRRAVAFLVYMTTMLCIVSLVAAGKLDWTLVTWGIIGSMLFFGCTWMAKVLHAYTVRSNAGRRGRQRIPRGALEARLQLHHPGIELGRLRLLLVDRDFTGEDYQALLDLDDSNDVPSTVGASEAEIRRNPSFLVRESAPDSVVKPKNCSICLYPFKGGERVRIIPCLHQFHTECIDPWLRQNAICPVCKFPVVG